MNQNEEQNEEQQVIVFIPSKFAASYTSGPRFAHYKKMSNDELLETSKTNNEALLVLIFDRMLGYLLSFGSTWFSGRADRDYLWKSYFQEIGYKIFDGRFANMFANGKPEAYVVSALKRCAMDVFAAATGNRLVSGAEGKRVFQQRTVPVSSLVDEEGSEDEFFCDHSSDRFYGQGDLTELVGLIDSTLKNRGEMDSLIFNLYLDGYSYEEIREQLISSYGDPDQVPSVNALRARIFRMKGELREVLERRGFDTAA